MIAIQHGKGTVQVAADLTKVKAKKRSALLYVSIFQRGA